MKINELRIICDIDGTLCPIKETHQEYKDLVPDAEMLTKLRWYKEHGAIIVLNTSRNMNSFNGNLGRINAITAKVLLEWLELWDIPYDEILYGKPWPGHYGFYVDDRAVRPDEFLAYTADELVEICSQSSRKVKE